MLKINIVAVGKIRESYLKGAILEYSKRLSKYCNLNIIELPDKTIPEKYNESIENQIKDYESNEIISHIPKNSYTIALDLSGEMISSEEFASKLLNLQNSYSSITFIIGGTLGMNSKVKDLCNEKICFSKMTFPHTLIRVFLLEQIFRCHKINNNEKYHH